MLGLLKADSSSADRQVHAACLGQLSRMVQCKACDATVYAVPSLRQKLTRCVPPRATASDAQQPAQASALQTSSASQQSQARPAEGRESTGAAPQRDALLKRDSAKRDSLPVKKKARSPPIPFARKKTHCNAQSMVTSIGAQLRMLCGHASCTRVADLLSIHR